MGKETEAKQLKSKKRMTGYLRYRALMVSEFLWISKLENEGKKFPLYIGNVLVFKYV